MILLSYRSNKGYSTNGGSKSEEQPQVSSSCCCSRVCFVWLGWKSRGEGFSVMCQFIQEKKCVVGFQFSVARLQVELVGIYAEFCVSGELLSVCGSGLGFALMILVCS